MDTDIVEIVMPLAELAYRVLGRSALFSLVVLFLQIYSAVLLIDFILIIFNRNIGEDIKKLRYGTVRPLISYAGAAKRWGEIQSKLDRDNPSHFKVAVLEADAFIDRLVGQMGYEGRNLKERLDAVREGKIVCLAALREAHEMRNRIIREEDYTPTREEAKETLEKYRKLLDELQLL